jgi:phosphohistidine phosphatase
MGDSDRALDTEGRQDAAAAGRWLTEKGFLADIVLVSPSVRTQQTWACAGAMIPDADVVIEDALYDAMPEEIWATIEKAAMDADTVTVVAHNPGLQELAVNLLTEAPSSGPDADLIAAGFPTATVAVFDMQSAGGPRLEDLFNPRHAPPPFVEVWDKQDGEAP